MNLDPTPILPAFEVRFASLYAPGRGYAFPCDRQGHVDLDALSERARINYLFARGMVGREIATPCICAQTPAEAAQRH
jgi:hypothetical protein